MTAPPLDLIVIGAGPTGLTLAADALRRGLRVRIVDQKAHRSTYSKALVLHARTLEAFEPLGVVDALTAAGRTFTALNVTPTPGKPEVRVDLTALAWGDTRHPYWLSIPQYETERCLEEHLGTLGGRVEWQVSFEGLVDHGDRVEARLKHTDGRIETCAAAWLAGCDGGRSPVREAAGLGFERSSLEETFVLADALGDPQRPEDEGTSVLGRDGLMFVVPMPEPGRWRIIAHLAGHDPAEQVTIDPAFVDGLFRDRLGVDFGARDLTWTSQFVLKQGLADRYRAGRVFIAGDAAHLHSPVGGQGLNTGAQDALALAWRLALAQRAGVSDGPLLDSYEAERRPIARDMVRNTSKATRVMTRSNRLFSALRGFVARHALARPGVQNVLGRGVGMLDLAYADSPIAADGPRGEVGPGGRMPDPAADGARLGDLLHPTRHTLVVLGDEPEGFDGIELPVVRPADAGFDAAALSEALGGAALVGVRPDGVIGFTDAEVDGAAVQRYAARLGVPVEAL